MKFWNSFESQKEVITNYVIKIVYLDWKSDFSRNYKT